MRRTWQIFTVTFVAALLVLAGTIPATAQNYPTKPIKLIVPWSPGGGTDVIWRIAATHMEKYIGQPVRVVNIKGVAGTIGVRQAKDSRPDGYTLVTIHESLSSSYETGVVDFSYDAFEAIALLTNTPDILGCHPKTPYNTLKEFVRYGKGHPGQIKMGATLGAFTHVFVGKLSDQTGLKFKVVGYEGTARRMQAIMGAHIDCAPVNYTAANKHYKAKRMKFLALATPERDPAIPEVPTFKELGVDLQIGLKRGLFAPKGTPAPIIAKLEDTMKKVASDPAFVKRIESLGSRVVFLPREDYKRYLSDLTKSVAVLAQKLGWKELKKK